MELARRTRWFALTLPVALAAAAVLARPAPPGVLAAASVAARSCSAGGAPSAAASAGPAWFRLDPVLDATGTLAGQRLTVGRGAARWTEALPPESFASGPLGGRVLVGDDDGRRSRLRLLDTARGCWIALGVEADVVRSAIATPDGTMVYEHRVERRTRRDLGVWQLAIGGGSAAALPVLPGLGPDAAAGPTFATSLLVGSDGRLAVSACGLRACRVRVVEPRSGTVASVNGTGEAIALGAGGLLTRAACDGLPCPIEVVDLATGARTSLPGTSTGAERVVLSSTATSGIEGPSGMTAIAPDGRVADPSAVRFVQPDQLGRLPGEVLP